MEFWKILQTDNFLRPPKGKYLRKHIFVPYCSVHVWQKFYAIWEFYIEEETFCLGRVACFGLLNISRLFRQLCQHQAHAVNHQPTKCGTADFHNRQNRTSQESDTFPIKFLQLASSSMFSIDNYMHEKNQVIKRKRQKKTLFFQRTFLNDGKTTNSCHSQTLSTMFFFFVIRTFTCFNLFQSWLCFALCSNLWGFIF